MIAQNEFSFEVFYAIIARILFSTCWDLLWWIKTDFLLNYCMQWLQEYYFLHVGILCDCMQWLQEYYFLHVGTFCDESKHIFFWSDEYTNIARLLFSTWWNIVWCIKTHFLLKNSMQWSQEYYFLHDILWYIKIYYLFNYCMQWLQE